MKNCEFEIKKEDSDTEESETSSCHGDPQKRVAKAKRAASRKAEKAKTKAKKAVAVANATAKAMIKQATDAGRKEQQRLSRKTKKDERKIKEVEQQAKKDDKDAGKRKDLAAGALQKLAPALKSAKKAIDSAPKCGVLPCAIGTLQQGLDEMTDIHDSCVKVKADNSQMLPDGFVAMKWLNDKLGALKKSEGLVNHLCH